MKYISYIIIALLACQFANAKAFTDTLIIEQGVIGEHYSPKWKASLVSRMNKEELDSLAAIPVIKNDKDKAWVELIASKTKRWNKFRDSLELAFTNCHVPDTLFVMLGFAGGNDGFTYQYNTVCMDVSFLQKYYGNAMLPENSERIDRIFSHEYTHLIYKQWMKKHKAFPVTFKDSVFWECAYEGLGMYRSLSKKWFAKNGMLPDTTVSVLNKLYPEFVAMLTEVKTRERFTADDKKRIVAHLSNGPVNAKWGAFPIAIWLSLEANGDDRKLAYWIDKGREGVILLAKKYLDERDRMAFEKAFR